MAKGGGLLKALLGTSESNKVLKAAIGATGKKKAKQLLFKVIVPDLKTRKALNAFWSVFYENGGTFKDGATKATKTYLKRLLHENVPITTYIEQWNREGFKKTLERFVFNRVVPHEIKNFYYFINTFKANVKNEVAKANEELLNNPMVTNEEKLTYLYKMEEIANSGKNDKENQTIKRRYFNFYFPFAVNSPQTGNFSQEAHVYNFYKEEYIVPIRSGNRKYVKNYTYRGVKINIIEMALTSRDYGVVIFSRIRSN